MNVGDAWRRGQRERRHRMRLAHQPAPAAASTQPAMRVLMSCSFGPSENSFASEAGHPRGQGRPARGILPVMFDAPPAAYIRDGDRVIAYQVVGDGPVDLVFATGGVLPIDVIWEDPNAARFLRRLASFSRLVLYDADGWGSSRSTRATAPVLEEAADDV